MRATGTSREFRKMSYALQYSAATLVWALVLLVFVIYFFSTVFTQATTEHVRLLHRLESIDEDTDRVATLREMYGSLASSFYSLFQAISNGRDWRELVQPLDELHWAFKGLFLTFVSVTTFGVMNVVTSVFVESALLSVQHYKDLLIQESLKTKSMYMDHLLDVFQEIDVDGSGTISMNEMEEFLDDPKLQMYLESMDIQPDEARTLFSLLDKDDSGTVSIDEFCQGCLRLKGEAKSFDIHCIIFENNRLAHKWQLFMNYMEKGFGKALNKAIEKAVDARHGTKKEPQRRIDPLALAMTDELARQEPTATMGDNQRVGAVSHTEPGQLCQPDIDDATPQIPGQLFKPGADDATPQIPYGLKASVTSSRAS